MPDSDRWLRPGKRWAWQGMKSVLATLGVFASVFALGDYWFPHKGASPAKMLFCWGVVMPIYVLGKRLVHWLAHRSLAWHVDAAGVAIHRRGTLVRVYNWSQILSVDRLSKEEVAIRTGDAWRKHRLRLIRPEDVRWFRGVAHDYLGKAPERSAIAADSTPTH